MCVRCVCVCVCACVCIGCVCMGACVCVCMRACGCMVYARNLFLPVDPRFDRLYEHSIVQGTEFEIAENLGPVSGGIIQRIERCAAVI